MDALLLTLLWVLPAVGSLAALLGRAGRFLGILLAAAAVVLALVVWRLGAPPEALIWMSHPWNVGYRLGIDGVGIVMVLLTAVIALPSAIAARGDGGRLAWLLLLAASATGVFLSRDLVLFYAFWELMLVPAYFLIASGDRRAALQFLIYNVAGSLAMLAGIVVLGASAGTFDMSRLASLHISPVAQGWLLAAFGLGFAVKTPLWPLHGWVADAYSSAPGEAAALIGGVQSKAGLYGFWRIALPLMPVAIRADWGWLAALALVSVLYGGFVALTQRDPRRMVAYASVSHLGLVALGLLTMTAAGITGAVVEMWSHGAFTAMLFLLLGALGVRLGRPAGIGALGGLYRKAPAMGALFTFAAMAGLGLPGLAGFPGELLILVGVYARSPAFAIAASVALVLAAAYMLRAVQELFHGPAAGEVADLRGAERWLLVPLIAALLVVGLYPQSMTARLAPDVGVAYALPRGGARA